MLTFVRNISVRVKLLLLVVPPLLGMLVYAGLSTRNDLQLYAGLQLQQQLVQARTQLDLSVRDYLQLRSAQLSGNNAQAASSSLLRNLEQLHQQTASLPTELQRPLQHYRTRVQESLDTPLNLAGLLQADHPINQLASQLELFSTLLSGHADGLTTRWHSAHHALLLAVTRLDEERLLMAVAFEETYFPTGAYPRFVRLLSEQSVFFNSYNNQLPDHPELLLKQWLQGEKHQQVSEIRSLAEQIYLDGNFGLSTPADQWLQLTDELMQQPLKQRQQLLDSLAQQVNTELQAAGQRLIVIGLSNLLLVFTGALVAWFIYRQISGPTLQLTRTMEGVAQDLDLTRKLALPGKDETAQAAQAFDTMLAQVRKLLQQVIHATTEVSNSSSLGQRVANNLDQQVQQGQQRLQEMLTSVEELHQAIHGIANNAETSQQASLDASQLAANGSQLVQTLQQHNQTLESALRDSASKVNELAEHSEKVNNILNVINDIAEQTNLLALNAAIEAARAGEAGRGFAVVADEVRSLAGRSRDATVEISRLLDANRQAAQQAVSKMEFSLQQADEVSHHLEQAGASLNNINQAVGGIHSANVETASAASQQRVTADQLSQLANGMHALYQETTQAVGELEHNSQSLEQLLQGLEQQLQRFTT
ncbi:methyl-accepting chemotaxis protein [Marinospirillum alkaliphilum]|uniref:Methyl-accepting chemotaxis protein n=1 Tax=Marinospirillum alkaliphilum DSM 21637 TaxID=1122209 RepID=A0A1K1TG87_9GAMM|nr:methyl-accepting chemotaxis protein [Marinospirillum alkaliphilum]SFW99498.1 Methyl-accepting chemotaxis protein [Marinospirillum alkaliphilum DSM 21637]